MRVVAIVLIVLLLAPVASALIVPPRAQHVPSAAALGLPGPRDGDVLLELAHAKGLAPARLAVPIPSASDDLASVIARLAERMDASTSVGDLAEFDALDARIRAPVLVLLLAMEQAWDLRDAALGPEREASSPITPEQEEELVTAAILLTDTIDSIVIPQLQALSGLPVWPPVPIADPVGVVRIGSGGDDVDLLYRILSIDGAGNDWYPNDIAIADPLRSPIAAAIDLGGDDDYTGAAGRGEAGVSIFYDTNGADKYVCGQRCFASTVDGVAVFRDVAGNDNFTGSYILGATTSGLSYFRDDQGDDYHRVGPASAGYGSRAGLGLFWDRNGADEYRTHAWTIAEFGYADQNAYGWFVDEGPETDIFWVNSLNIPYGRGRCNDCTWSASAAGTSEGFGGRGNDNSGGLPYLFAYQDTH